MTERKTKTNKKGRFKALDLEMPALKRIMFRVELPGALKRSYPA